MTAAPAAARSVLQHLYKGIDGFEITREIRKDSRIPIVMLTAYGQEELVSRAVEAGVFGLGVVVDPRNRTARDDVVELVEQQDLPPRVELVVGVEPSVV